MSDDDNKRQKLANWGFTDEEIDFILDPAFSSTAADRQKPIETMVMARVNEINRILAPVGLRYDVRQVRAE